MTHKKEKIPEYLKTISVDWAWVRERVLIKERIPADRKGAAKSSLLGSVDDCLRVARHLINPRIASGKRKVLDACENSISLEGSITLSGSSLATHLGGSSHAHIFIVTIGPDLEETATMLMESGEELHGYLLDRIGSFVVESLAEALERELRRIYRPRDMSVSMRFSPGYCDWPIEEQFKLEKAIGFSGAFVRLTKSCMMIPRKSISGIIGVGPRDLFSKSKSQCDICDRKNCDYKRAVVG